MKFKNLISSMEGGNFHWSIREKFIDFLKKNHRFCDAEIIGQGREQFTQWPFYNYRDVPDEYLWKVKLKNKSYAIGINDPGYWSRARARKFVFRRYYEPGEKKISRSRKRIKIEQPQLKTQKGGAALKNDCQLVSLALLTDAEYVDVHKEMDARGWTENNAGNIEFSRGLVKNRWDEVLELFGCKKELVWAKQDRWSTKKPNNKILGGKDGMTAKTAAKSLPKGKYVIETADHVLTIINNKLYDRWDSQNTRVRNIWKVTKK